ncbi:MAG: trypsin-like peptidase domain-containing protein [Planctomycetaceae bacterium]
MKSVNAVMLAAIAMKMSLCSVCSAQEAAAGSGRETPIVRAIQKSTAGIVSLFVVREGAIVSGSGTIVHPAGFVLTNNHVLPSDEGFALIGSSLPNSQKPIQFQTIGRYPERDLAIVRLLGDGPWQTVTPGRSHDLMNGETVIVAGNPGGRGLVFTSGIVSSNAVLAGAPNALVMTNYQIDRRPRFIQFDAASNGGNSGGPLLNIDGEVIGVVSEKIFQEQNVGFAIPIDTVYQLIEDIIEAELRSGFTTGIRIRNQGGPVIVSEVEADSAASDARIEPGDIVTAVNDLSTRNVIDWYLNLRQILSTDAPLKLNIQRSGVAITASIRATKRPDEAATAIDTTKLQPGLNYELFPGQYSLLPDFAQLNAASSGVTKSVSLAEVKRESNDYYAVTMSGYLHMETEGLIRLTLISDDGSKAFLNDRLLIDNDGNHPPSGVGEWLRLSKGMHRIRIEYFQGNGGAELDFRWQRENEEPRPVPASHLFHAE